jgi:hypothetical protein
LCLREDVHRCFREIYNTDIAKFDSTYNYKLLINNNNIMFSE